MNFQTLLMGLLKDPAFQAIVQSIVADMFAKISSGVNPLAAAQQGGAQVGAATIFHLTGNPVADIQSLVAGLQPHAGAATAVSNAAPAPGAFTS
jgi:hypothetical protein